MFCSCLLVFIPCKRLGWHTLEQIFQWSYAVHSRDAMTDDVHQSSTSQWHCCPQTEFLPNPLINTNEQFRNFRAKWLFLQSKWIGHALPNPYHILKGHCISYVYVPPLCIGHIYHTKHEAMHTTQHTPFFIAISTISCSSSCLKPSSATLQPANGSCLYNCCRINQDMH